MRQLGYFRLFPDNKLSRRFEIIPLVGIDTRDKLYCIKDNKLDTILNFERNLDIARIKVRALELNVSGTL